MPPGQGQVYDPCENAHQYNYALRKLDVAHVLDKS